MSKFNYTQDKLSEMMGKSRAHIANTLRLKKLPKEIQDMIISGLLTPGHARALIDVIGNVELAKTVANNNLSVRQTELLAKKANAISLQKKIKAKLQKIPNIVSLIENLQNKTGISVELFHNKK
jgi:ParB family transcriptional regulator, chromosome partitioning protein